MSRGAASDVYGADASGGRCNDHECAATKGRGFSPRAGATSHARLSAYGGRGSRQRVSSGRSRGSRRTASSRSLRKLRGPIDSRCGLSAWIGPGGARRRDARRRAHIPGLPSQRVPSRTARRCSATRRSISQVTGLRQGHQSHGLGWLARADVATQDYEQTFSAVLDGRAAERQTSAQVIGATSGGAHAEFSMLVHRRRNATERAVIHPSRFSRPYRDAIRLRGGELPASADRRVAAYRRGGDACALSSGPLRGWRCLPHRVVARQRSEQPRGDDTEGVDHLSGCGVTATHGSRSRRLSRS